MAFGQRLAEMWRALPLEEGENLPRRSAVRASFVASMMPNCWQLVWQPEDRLIIEFEGAEVDAMWGDYTTGEDYLANFSAERKKALLKFYETLFVHRCGGSILRTIRRQAGPEYELVTNFVPMLCDKGENRIIFGNSEMQGDFKASSGRLDFNQAVMRTANYIDLGHGIPSVPPFASSP